MPATFVVEDGTGKADANSLVALAEMDQYFLDHAPPAAYTAAAQPQKEEWARQGTQYVCLRYGARWRGYRSNGAQALDFPRSALIDTDGYGWSASSIPPRIKQGVYEAVRRLAAGKVLLPDQMTPGTVISTDVAVGPLKKSVTYGGAGQSATPYFSEIAALLRPFLKANNQAERA